MFWRLALGDAKLHSRAGTATPGGLGAQHLELGAQLGRTRVLQGQNRPGGSCVCWDGMGMLSDT